MSEENTPVTSNKNEKYKHEDITKLIKIYHMAIEAGDERITQDAFTKIYNHINKYVCKTLWDNYGTLMKNPNHREDIMQEVWLKIFNELKNYNPDKGAITTFIAPWIKHVIAEYASKNFRKTSVYYANAMTKINGAQNYCRQYGLNPDDMELIINLTGLSETTIKNTLDLMAKKDNISYEALIDAGADYVANIKGPEDALLEIEAENNLYDILNEVLDDEERSLIIMLLNPENDNKKHASYREIADRLPGSNIPQIKRKISRITTKLKNNKRFMQAYPYIIAQEKSLEDGFLAVFEEDPDTDEDMYDSFEDEED